MKKLYCLIIVIVLVFYPLLNAQWVKTGFNGAGVTSIVAKEGNLFASTWGGAIYGSTDGGATWTADTNGLGYWFYTSYVYALAVVPSSDNSGATNLFAGMEEGGIWRSTNDGASWEWVFPLGVLGENDINIICLGNAGSTILGGAAQQGGNNGIYRSANDGGTWTRCNAGFQTAADSNVRCFSSLKFGASTNFYAGTDGGAFISTTDGTSWTRISNGLPAGSIFSIVATPGNNYPGINLFAGVGNSGIYHSTDNGSTWSEVNNGIPTMGQTPYIQAIVASPVPGGTSSNIFAIDNTVYVSTNYGAKWWDTGWPVTTASAATCLGINGDVLLGGSSFTNQIWKYSVSFDSDWVVQQSSTTDTLWSVKAVDNNIVWAGGTSGSVVRTTNGGIVWTSVGGGIIGNDFVFVVEPLDANTAFVSSTAIDQSGPTSSKIFKTTNGGSSWTQVFSQTNGFIGGIQMQSALLGFAVGSPVSGKWTILKSTDGGNTWNHIATEPAQAGTESGLRSFQLAILFGLAHLLVLFISLLILVQRGLPFQPPDHLHLACILIHPFLG